MTEDEFELLVLRFGKNITAWPAPYRQQALLLSEGKHDLPSDRDDVLDRLVLEAASDDVDDGPVVSRVLAHIEGARNRTVGIRLSGILLRPAAMAGCSALLFLALAAGGYHLAASHDDALDAKLLALATGSPASAGIVDLSPDDDTENAL